MIENLNKKMGLVEAKTERKMSASVILTSGDKSYENHWAKCKIYICTEHTTQVSSSVEDCDLVWCIVS